MGKDENVLPQPFLSIPKSVLLLQAQFTLEDKYCFGTVVVLYLKHVVVVRTKASLEPEHFPNHTVYRRVKAARKVNILNVWLHNGT